MPQLYGDTYSLDTIYPTTTALQAVDTTTYRDGVRAQVTDSGIYQFYRQAISGSVVPTTGGGAWNLVTDPYLMLNSSNEIDPSQIESVSDIRVSDGTAAAPSISYENDQDTGWYRISANTIGMSLGGTLRNTYSTSARTSTLISLGPDGSASAPTYSFANSTNTGLFYSGANTCFISANGTGTLEFAASVITASVPIVGSITATAAAPAFATASNDLDTGFYSAAANSIGTACNGANTVTFTTSAINMATGVALQVNATQVVGARNTGWTTFAGTGTKNQGAINVDTFTATDANIRLLGQGVKGILDALIAHGLLGA